MFVVLKRYYFSSIIEQYFGITFDTTMKCAESEEEPATEMKEHMLQYNVHIDKDVKYLHSGLVNVSGFYQCKIYSENLFPKYLHSGLVNASGFYHFKIYSENLFPSSFSFSRDSLTASPRTLRCSDARLST